MKHLRALVPLSVVVLCVLTARPPSPAFAIDADNAATDEQRADILRDRLKLLGLQKARWEHVIQTEDALARQPDRQKNLARDAAGDLRGAGREMMFEGLSDGLGGVLSLEAAYAHRFEPIARHYKQEAANVNFAYQNFVKDRVAAKKPGDPKPEELIDKIVSEVDLGSEFVTDPDVKQMIGVMMPLTKGGLRFMSAYIRGDPQEMDATFESTKSLLEGTLAMLGAMAQDPAKLQGVAGAIAREYPDFGAAAGFMSSTALTDFNIALGLAKIGFGTYGMWEAHELDNQAEAISEKNEAALVLLRRLLPRAQSAINQARDEEARLQAELDVIEKRLQPPTTVLPSQRFIDDGVGVPAHWVNLMSTLDVVATLPEVTSGMTEAEKHRLAEEERQRQEAAAEAEERRQELAAEARRESAREDGYAEERHSYYAPQHSSHGSSSAPAAATAPVSSITTDPNSCFVRHCLGGGAKNFDAANAVNRVIDGINRQQGGGTLGLIQHPR